MPKARSKVSRKRKFYGNRFTKLAFNSNNTSASEAKLSTFDSFDVPEPEFHGSTGNRIINFQALMGIISIFCCPECYATRLKLAEDTKEGLCSNLCGFMTGFTSTSKENKKFSLNTLLVFGLRLMAEDSQLNYYGIAIRSNVGCLEKMQSAVIAAFFHCCSSNQNPMHGQCPTGKDSWCKYKQALREGIGIDPTTLKNYMGMDKERIQKSKRQSLPSIKLSRKKQKAKKKSKLAKNEAKESLSYKYGEF
ncbi:uncharacterized protein TNCV_3821421 [Trichonephila clavipes]|nr:uncharacterized protein TNCV_3821421 [Trichonephila clavipes]